MTPSALSGFSQEGGRHGAWTQGMCLLVNTETAHHHALLSHKHVCRDVHLDVTAHLLCIPFTDTKSDSPRFTSGKTGAQRGCLRLHNSNHGRRWAFDHLCGLASSSSS